MKEQWHWYWWCLNPWIGVDSTLFVLTFHGPDIICSFICQDRVLDSRAAPRLLFMYLILWRIEQDIVRRHMPVVRYPLSVIRVDRSKDVGVSKNNGYFASMMMMLNILLVNQMRP